MQLGKKNHKLLMAFVGAIVLLLLGVSFSMNASVIEGRLRSTKTSMEAESTDEVQNRTGTTKMEAESTDELKPRNGMEAEDDRE